MSRRPELYGVVPMVAPNQILYDQLRQVITASGVHPSEVLRTLSFVMQGIVAAVPLSQEEAEWWAQVVHDDLLLQVRGGAEVFGQET